MRILLLAPHPFYQERGTPIAVELLIKALVERGDRVDVVVYPEGETRDYGDQVRIIRVQSHSWLTGIRPGFSMKKLLADICLYRVARHLVQAHDYDVIHAVEESVFIARRLGRRFQIPYVFDMDSSMPEQIVDKFNILRPVLSMMRCVERSAIRDAAAVVPMCDALAESAKQMGARHVVVLRDISLMPHDVEYDAERAFRQPHNISGRAVLYVGNLESYQGIDLLVDAFRLVAERRADVTLVVVGGREDDVKRYQQTVEAVGGLSDRIVFTGPKPVGDMVHLFEEADILVSPRIAGTNTPMKVYSYLDAGKPLVATRLPTHTQVMDDSVAMLVDPDAESMAAGIVALLDDSLEAGELANRARRLARDCYSYDAFRQAVNTVYDELATRVGDS